VCLQTSGVAYDQTKHRPDPVAATAIHARFPNPTSWQRCTWSSYPATPPKDVVADAEGSICTGVEDGRTIRITPDGSSTQVVTNTGGRPLGP
jgi:hypothetical protein